MTKLSPYAIDFLQRLPLLSTLDGDAMRRMLAATKQVDAPRGTILLRRGNVCDGLYVVVRGRFKMSLETRQGDEKVIALLGSGARFGDALLYTSELCLATVQAIVDSIAVCIAKGAVLHEISTNTAFALHIIEDLSRRLYQRTKEVESYTLLSGTQRLINYLLSEEPESTVNGVRHVMLLERKGVIASRLNLTQEHFSRILRDLAMRKLIQVDGAHVVIPDVAQLHSACV
jgi:CRP/FNR family transcriptional regulator, dissimilatory nitrate respiration regulator